MRKHIKQSVAPSLKNTPPKTPPHISLSTRRATHISVFLDTPTVADTTSKKYVYILLQKQTHAKTNSFTIS